MTLIKYSAVLLSLIFPFSILFAAAQDDFDTGVAYFKQQKYQQAIASFSAAHKKGLQTPALLHNLGVSHYKLKNYGEAKKYFELARRDPQQTMLAEYNLGLVAKKQNKPEIARQHFLLVKKHAGESKLVTLARIQLGEVRAIEPERDWYVYGKLSYGHDDNITVIPETSVTTATKKSSNFTDIYLGGNAQVLGQPKSGIALTGFASRFNYLDYDLYDDSSLALGIEATFPTGRWANALELNSQKVSYGHKDYQAITQFQAGTKTSLSRDNSLRFRYQFDDITSKDPTYDYLAGTRQSLRAELRNYGRAHYARLYYEFEWNNRVNTATANFSPYRNTVRAYYEYFISDAFRIGADVHYRVSIYPARAATPERQDTRRRLGLNLDYKLDNTWKLRLAVEQTDNESTNPIYTYQRELTALSVIANF